MQRGRLVVERVPALSGTFRPPSDKSLTHRAYLLGAIASGESVVRNPLRGEDCEATLRCLAQMGLEFEWLSPSEVRLRPTEEWRNPSAPLDCGNSGTTMRLIAGLVASRQLDVTLIGDPSLSKRPMKRIAEPLRLMGATVGGDTSPLRIADDDLIGIAYESPVASAQIKSCILLAGLRARGAVTVTEPTLSRDHTERMLRALGVPVQTIRSADGRMVAQLDQPDNPPSLFEFDVPADISSASFLLVAGALLGSGPGVKATDVGVNPTRTGVLDVLKSAGAAVEMSNERVELGEPIADLRVSASSHHSAFEIAGPLVPRLIDEIPCLAVLATQCEGTSVIRNAQELRIKESDRIEAMAEGLQRMGARVETFEDGMAITGPTPLRGIHIDASHDHRVAMSFAVAGMIAEGQTVIEGAESIATSYPDFEYDLRALTCWRAR